MIQSHWRSYHVRRVKLDKMITNVQKVCRGVLVRRAMRQHRAAAEEAAVKAAAKAKGKAAKAIPRVEAVDGGDFSDSSVYQGPCFTLVVRGFARLEDTLDHYFSPKLLEDLDAELMAEVRKKKAKQKKKQKEKERKNQAKAEEPENANDGKDEPEESEEEEEED
eukprot:g19509.t1